MHYWHVWRYKNITLSLLFAFLTFALLRHSAVQDLFLHLGSLGYIGAFFAGMLFVSIFTVSIGAILLVLLAQYLSPLEIALTAGLGGLLGDLIIFHFFKSTLAREVNYLFKKYANRHFIHLFHTRYFAWTLPVVGALIMVSPIPDELGISLIGISKLNLFQFVIISFALNFIGIFAIVFTAAQL